MAAAACFRSSQGQKRTPGTSGSKGSRYFAVHVIESDPSVRPWKDRSKATSSVRPWSRPMRRANLMAPSTASVPELQKKTLAGKARETSRSARAVAGGLW